MSMLNDYNNTFHPKAKAKWKWGVIFLNIGFAFGSLVVILGAGLGIVMTIKHIVSSANQPPIDHSQYVDQTSTYTKLPDEIKGCHFYLVHNTTYNQITVAYCPHHDTITTSTNHGKFGATTDVTIK